jgi:hypothetical protein
VITIYSIQKLKVSCYGRDDKSELVRAVLEKDNIKQQGNREHDHTNHRWLLVPESPRVF